MSRIGKLPVTLPQGVKVSIKEHEVTVTGPKGELRRQFHPDMVITLKDNAVLVARPSDSKLHRSLHGLTRTLLSNMVDGVTKGFQKELEIVGVGYRAIKAGDKLTVNVGYSNPVEITPLPGISLGVEGTHIKVTGANKETVGQMAAQIRKVRPPDHYKGKGIRYAGEVVHLKPGKAGKAIGQTK